LSNGTESNQHKNFSYKIESTMITKPVRLSAPSPKKAYKTPSLKVLGNVKKLTLKVGSLSDGLGSGSFGG
jgi:hypothetical protein